MIFIIHIYYNGTGIIANMSEKIKSLVRCDCCESQTFSTNKTIFLKLIPIISINLWMAAFFLYKRKPGVSRYILSILMVNMALYVICYISNKLYYRCKIIDWKPSEGLRIVTCLYGVASFLFMAGAAYFFSEELKTSAGTPAESRNLNGSCFFLIFDNHDMWHFLSAAGLFSLFMFILTMEDYNLSQPRNKIAVF